MSVSPSLSSELLYSSSSSSSRAVEVPCKSSPPDLDVPVHGRRVLQEREREEERGRGGRREGGREGEREGRREGKFERTKKTNSGKNVHVYSSNLQCAHNTHMETE